MIVICNLNLCADADIKIQKLPTSTTIFYFYLDTMSLTLVTFSLVLVFQGFPLMNKLLDMLSHLKRQLK